MCAVDLCDTEFRDHSKEVQVALKIDLRIEIDVDIAGGEQLSTALDRYCSRPRRPG